MESGGGNVKTRGGGERRRRWRKRMARVFRVTVFFRKIMNGDVPDA